jgi:hypothetical protein
VAAGFVETYTASISPAWGGWRPDHHDVNLAIVPAQPTVPHLLTCSLRYICAPMRMEMTTWTIKRLLTIFSYFDKQTAKKAHTAWGSSGRVRVDNAKSINL